MMNKKKQADGRHACEKATATRLLKSYMDAGVFRPEWTFVVSPTAPSQRHLFSYLGISDGNVYTSNLKPAIDAILERMTTGKAAWEASFSSLLAVVFSLDRSLSTSLWAILNGLLKA